MRAKNAGFRTALCAGFAICLAIAAMGQTTVNRTAATARPASPYKSPILKRLWEQAGVHRAQAKAPANTPDLNSPFLTTPPIYATGTSGSEFDIALGDFNNDGKQDVIIAPPMLLLGNGDGTLQTAMPVGTISATATSVAVGDFNRDGNLDAVFAISGAAAVFLGNGNGTFQAATYFSCSGANWTVLVDDVNNDGLADLILSTSTGVCVLLGNGNGSFQSQILSSGNALYMAVADFNNDGRPDLAATDGYSNLSIMLGSGTGTFTVSSSYSVNSANLDGVAAADYNRDGFRDVALPNGQIFLGNGDGTLQAPTTFSTSPYASSIATADMNGDGIADLITLSSFGFCGDADFGSTGVSLGNGDGTFQPVIIFDSGGCNYPSSSAVAVGYINNDELPDVVALSGTTGYFSDTPEISVMINQGKGILPAAESDIAGGSGGIAVNDFNRDGNADAVLADGSVYLGNGNGGLSFVETASLGGIAIQTGEFNHDVKPDLAAVVECAPAGCDAGGELAIALGNGDGTFQTPTFLPSGGSYSESLAVADFNGDGNLDIAIANECAESDCSGNGSVSIFLGNASGTFTLLTTITGITGSPLSIIAGDFNNDGIVDLAASGVEAGGNFGVGVVNMLPGNGDGTFKTAVVTSFDNPGITASASGDFNQDGILDLAVANGDVCSDCGGTGSILYGNGDGTFSLGPGIGTEGAPAVTAVAADFYGTGTPTPVLANRCGDPLDCPYGSVMIYGTENETDIMLLYLAVGDFNNDGKPDLAGSLQFDSGASILLNNGATLAASTTTLSPATIQTYQAFQPVTFTVQVGHTGPNSPTGLVNFLDNGVSIGSAALTSKGRATFTTTQLMVGVHFIVADYQGNSNFAPSNSLGVHVTINRTSTTTTVKSSANPAEYNEIVKLTATISPSFGSGATGTVTFYDGSIKIGTVQVASDMASLSTRTLAVGTHSITAAYSGDSNFLPSTSGVLSQVVNKATTNTALTSSPNPSQMGQPVTFTAQVIGEYGGIPGESVTFKEGSKILKTVPLNRGVAQYTTSTLPQGHDEITANYKGNSDFLPSSGTVVQVVK